MKTKLTQTNIQPMKRQPDADPWAYEFVTDTQISVKGPAKRNTEALILSLNAFRSDYDLNSLSQEIFSKYANQSSATH
jgi:hypothetical protein